MILIFLRFSYCKCFSDPSLLRFYLVYYNTFSKSIALNRFHDELICREVFYDIIVGDKSYKLIVAEIPQRKQHCRSAVFLMLG